MAGMTVGELITELKKYPEDDNIYLSKKGCRYSWTCQGVHDYDLDIDGCITLTNEPNIK